MKPINEMENNFYWAVFYHYDELKMFRKFYRRPNDQNEIQF